jgi:hypothetical protein
LSIQHILRIATPLLIFSCCRTLSAEPGSTEPPFDWYEAYLSDNPSLEIEECSRNIGPHGIIITYTIKAEGFSPHDSFSLWKKNGDHFSEYKYKLEYPVELSRNIQIEINFQIENFSPGQVLDLAMVSKDTSRIAHSRTIPIPIAAKGTNGCLVEAELTSETGHYFLMTFKGFEPEEKVEIVNQFSLDKVSYEQEATEDGTIYSFVGFEKWVHGKAEISANGNGHSVSMEYDVGKDAITAKQ